MRYLLPSSVAVRHLTSLRRPLAPAHDAVALAQLVDVMRDFRPQIVHTHMAKAGTLGRLAAAIYNRTAGRGRARARRAHVPRPRARRIFQPDENAGFLGVERGLARATDRIVAISPRIRRELLERLPHRPRRSIPRRPARLRSRRPWRRSMPAARAEARAALRIPAGAAVVTTVGRLTAIKQHRLFLETAALVAPAIPPPLFLIAGDGELRAELEDAARGARPCGANASVPRLAPRPGDDLRRQPICSC